MASHAAKLQKAIAARKQREDAHLEQLRHSRELARNRAIAAAGAAAADKIAASAAAGAAQKGA